MNSQDLYDLSPALQLMITGVAVAMGPLVWIFLRHRRAAVAQRLRVLTLMTLFFTFDLIVFGAFTRLTDSGLGCPDWPGCYGSASPVGAQVHIQAAQTAMPSGPVTHSKAWIEMVHRYLATGVGVLILTLTVVSWLEYRRLKNAGGSGAATRATRPGSQMPLSPAAEARSWVGGSAAREATDGARTLHPWWSTLTLLWVCLQGAFGALTVTMKLFPAIVTMHLLGGLVLLALLRAQAAHQAQATREAIALSFGLRAFLIAAFALLWLQIALGGWVSTNYAVLACTDFPACQGSLWPSMDFSQGFRLWRELGEGHDGANISFQALTAIHYVHRLTAYLVFAAFLTLAIQLHRLSATRTQARWLAGLTLLQVVTGVTNAVLGWPLLAAVLHTAGAAALVLVLTGLVFSSRGVSAAVHGSRSKALEVSV